MPEWISSLDAFLKKGKIRYFGLGLTIAWVYCTWFSPAFFEAGSAAQLDSLRTSLTFSAIGLLVLAFRPGKRKPLPGSLILGGAAVVSVTTLLFFFVTGGVPILVVSAIGGLASGLIWVGWGELFCEVGLENAESSIPASLATFVVAVLVVALVPRPVSGILSAGYPLISCVMLLLGKGTQSEDFEFPEPDQPFSSMLPALLRLALCSMACSVATGFVVTSITPDECFMGVNGLIDSYVLGGAAAGVVAVVAIAHASRLNFSFLYEVVIPLIVVSLSLRALGGMTFNTIAMVLSCTAALYVEVLFFAIFARVTARGLALPSETFGIFRALVQLGFLLGGLMGASATPETLLPGCLVLICVCVIMLPLFLHLQQRFEEPVDRVRADAASAEVPEGAGESDAVVRIAADYSLSPREVEVLGYLGRGRSVPYMREAMVLSKSTIETHIKHIYAKTDVHSKQELIDLIESYRNA